MRHVSRMCIGAALFGCAVFSLLLFGQAGPLHAADPIKIGVVSSITGVTAFIGTPQKDLITAVVESTNKHGGLLGRQVELFLEDDQSQATNAVIAVAKLARDRKVAAIVGPSNTDSGMAMIPTCDQEQVPFVLTAPCIGDYKKWVFYLGAGDAKEGMQALEFAVKALGAKRIALFSSTDNHGSTLSNAVLKDIGKYPGVSFVIHEKCEATDTSMIPQLTKIKAANPDMLLVFMQGNTAAVVARNYRQLGMTTQVVTSHGVPMPSFLKIAGDAAEQGKWIMFGNFLAVVEKYPDNDPMKRDVYEPLKKVLQEKYGKGLQPNIFHAVASDGIRAVLDAIKLAGSDDRAAIRDALEKVRFMGFVGEYAPTATDHQGSPKPATVPMVLKNGELYPYPWHRS